MGNEKTMGLTGFTDKINLWAGKILAPLVIVIGVLLCGEAIARYVFNSPSVWVYDLSSELGAVFYFMIGGYTLIYKNHVAMDIFYNKFSKKAKPRVDIILSVFFFLFVGILFWHSFKAAIYSVKIWEATQPPWSGPLWPARVTLALGCFILLIEGIAKLLRDIHTSFVGDEK